MSAVGRYLWAAPWSLLGLLIGFTFERRYVTRGVVVAEGASWPRKLGWRYSAITLGHVILSVEPLDERTLRHELVHVRQYEAWGPFFIPVYVGASAAAILRRGHHYRDNRFEVAARAEE